MTCSLRAKADLEYHATTTSTSRLDCKGLQSISSQSQPNTSPKSNLNPYSNSCPNLNPNTYPNLNPNVLPPIINYYMVYSLAEL